MAYEPQPTHAHGPASTADQIQSLTDRGMAVPNAEFAARCLTHIGEYRLRFYWFPLQSSREQAAPFRPGASFDQVMTLYMFDQRLLALLAEYSSVPYDSMGFPSGWREFTIWQKHLPPTG